MSAKLSKSQHLICVQLLSLSGDANGKIDDDCDSDDNVVDDTDNIDDDYDDDVIIDDDDDDNIDDDYDCPHFPLWLGSTASIVLISLLQ